jgi:hypothetical protein
MTIPDYFIDEIQCNSRIKEIARGIEREIVSTCYFRQKTVEFFKIANNWVENRCRDIGYLESVLKLNSGSAGQVLCNKLSCCIAV